jgi:hypothetical protein
MTLYAMSYKEETSQLPKSLYVIQYQEYLCSLTDV